MALLLSASASVQAATFTVNTTQDTNDGACSTDANGCSLREAMNESILNGNTADSINFNIPSTDGGYDAATGVYTINLLNALPVITTNGTVIDGASQTAFSGDTNPQGPEVQVLGRIGSINVGFYDPADRIDGFKITEGFKITASNCSISNLVLNNFHYPISIEGGGGHTVRGCYIGTDVTGTQAMPNVHNDYKRGIMVYNSPNNTIGGIGAGQGNRITNALNEGVFLDYETGNSVRGNAIYSNGGLGIGLNYDGVTPNDSNDADSGTNNLQNFPYITAATVTGGDTSLTLALESVANKTYAIDVYRQPTAEVDPSGYGEGKTYVGTVDLTTDSNGKANGTLLVNGTFPTESFSATATDPAGNTSEFGFSMASGGSQPTVVKNTNDSGTGSFRSVIQYINGRPNTVITFAIPNTDSGYNSTTGVYSIRLLSSLPPITASGTAVYGSSQSGNTNTLGPEIELTGNIQGTGLNIQANSCAVVGMIINGFQTQLNLTGNNNIVRNCYLGTDETGTQTSPNNIPTGGPFYSYLPALNIEGNSVTVGGVSGGQPNRIAYSLGQGIRAIGTGINIRGNSIFNNGSLGLDVGGNGISPNGRSTLNYPVITGVTTEGGNTVVALSLNSVANKTYAVDVYRSPIEEADPSGFGEGKTYAGSVNLTTNSAGNGTATFTITGSIGTDAITATATTPDGSSSEFSFYAVVGSSLPSVVTNTKDDGSGSLRKAIQYVNGSAGGTITFNIPTADSGYNPTTGVWTISPLSALPQFNAPIVLDGSTQSGNSNPNGPEIEISGAAAVSVYGFKSYQNSVIRGLIINGYSTPILLQSNATVESCYIGTNANGMAASPHNNVSNTYGNGVEISGSGNTVGGDTPAKGNVIGFSSDNSTGRGVFLNAAATSNLIRNNTIISNSGPGVGFQSQNSKNTIRDNNIRDNGAAGVSLPAATAVIYQNTIRFNSIYNNGGIGIDIKADGVTPNDLNEANSHPLPNRGLNYPVLTGVTNSSNGVVITGTYNSRPNQWVEIDFYGNVAADASGYGEGQTFLGTAVVTNDASGNASFSKELSNVQGNTFSATATVIDNPNVTSDTIFIGDTSEFSNNVSLPTQLLLNAATYSVDESSSTATVSVVRQGPLDGTASVSYATQGVTATLGSDFSSTSGTLNWASGDGASKTVTIPLIPDSIDEADETFNLVLFNPSSGTSLGSPSSASVIIVDNDISNISINDVSIVEGNSSSKTLAFTASLSAANSRTVTVNYATSNGTNNPATTGTDYVATSGTLTFLTGELTKTVNVTINGDTVDEPNETFFVNLSEAVNATITDSQGLGTITDDDLAAPTVTLTRPNAEAQVFTSLTTLTGTAKSATELTLSKVTVRLYRFASAGVSAGYWAGGTSWTTGYTSANEIAATGTTNWTLTLPTLSEGKYSVIATATDSAGVKTSTPVRTFWIEPVKPTLSINDVTLTEPNSGTTNAIFTVKLNKVSGNTVTVRYATANGTVNSAMAGTDYTALPLTTLTFLSGETNKTIAVPVVGDTLNEPNETFRVLLSSAVNATVGDGEGIGTITNNDAVPSLAVGDVKVTEGNGGTVNAAFTIKLSAASGQVVKVNYATADGTVAGSNALAGSDYNAASGTLTFNLGETSKVVNVAVRGDLLDELDEQFQFKLSSPINAAIADGLGLGIIADEDATPTFSVRDVNLIEGNSGSTTMAFTVQLSAPSSRAITVSYKTAAGTSFPATENLDYIPVTTPVTLSFAAGQTSKAVNITIKGDLLDEDNETLQLLLSNPVNAGMGDGVAIGTINDDDAAPSVSIGNSSVKEGNFGDATPASLTFTVKLSAPSSRLVTIKYASITSMTLPASANVDYEVVPQTSLLFTAGETSKTVSLKVKGDALDEDDEQVDLKLLSVTNATLSTTAATGKGTILDDDASPALSINDVSIAEGNSGKRTLTFTVTLSAASGRVVTADFATANGSTANTSATAGSDYTGASGAVSFAVGQTTRTINIEIVGDTTFEANEQFKLLLSRPVNATLIKSTGIGTITNDDKSVTGTTSAQTS